MKKRFGGVEFSRVRFLADRLNEPLKIKKPITVFVGSMSDIEYWKPVHVESILDVCRKCPQHTFMFLSKTPLSYYGYAWSDNTMQGLTLTCKQTPGYQEDCHERMKNFPRPFLSIEPLLGKLYYDRNIKCYEKIIIGAMTGTGAVKPLPEWIDGVKRNAPPEKVFWKPSIRKYL
jgi:protein gp37